jgi:hypothetical protein
VSTLLFSSPVEHKRIRIAVTFRCDRCTDLTSGEHVEAEYSPDVEVTLLAAAERKLLDEGWEIRRGVRSESNPQACDGHRCPYCRRHP